MEDGLLCVKLDYSTYFQFNGDILYELDLRYIWDTWLRDTWSVRDSRFLVMAARVGPLLEADTVIPRHYDVPPSTLAERKLP
jgi:hypothetical protein